MELRHLRYFVAVADSLHFGRAAAELRIAQPSLSHQIRQLEVELGTTLLERTKRRVQLTEPGRLFLQQAREILAHADRAAVVARRAARGEVGRLRVGFAYWMNLTNLVAGIKALHARQPGISVDLRSASVSLQIAALRDQNLDVGFIRPSIAEPWLNSEILAAEPFVVALPADHRLASKKRIRLSALASEHFILVLHDAAPLFYDLSLKVCRNAGFVPHVRNEVDHPESVLALVGAGVGISLVPSWACRLRRPGVAFRFLRPSPRILQTVVVWRRNSASPLVAEFLKAVRETLRRGDKRSRGLSGSPARPTRRLTSDPR